MGPLLALTLVSMPAISFAQNNQNDMRSNGSMTYRSNMTNEFSAGPAVAKVTVVQTMHDKGFTYRDMVSILPLLQDLRDARQMCDAKMDDIYYDLTTTKRGHVKMSGDTRVQDCQRMLSDRQNSIWATISNRIGADKANSLRQLVEPTTEDVSRVAYTDVYLQRIDTMLKDLDRMAAARIAANGGANALDQNGVRQASVETVTTTVVTPTPIYVTTPAIISEKELVNVIQDRIVEHETRYSDAVMFAPMHRDISTTDLTFLREEKWKVWY